jgi:hypothetical protein
MTILRVTPHGAFGFGEAADQVSGNQALGHLHTTLPISLMDQ